MKYKLYDKCKLKDGRIGWIVEIFNDGEAYMIELDKKDARDWIIIVKSADIKSIELAE